jgi:hypothetical protein
MIKTVGLTFSFCLLSLSLHSTEVLNAAGVLDDIPSFSEEQIKLGENLKRRALSAANDFRQQVHQKLNPRHFRELLETDKMFTLGAATGAFVGFLV